VNTVLTIWALACLAEVSPPKPSSEFSGGIWYVLVVVAVVAFIAFYVVKRISDIAVKKKTEALIREIGEPNSSNNKDE
jgi:ABC-type transport system involved in cytochrome c biogenesis permease subunit